MPRRNLSDYGLDDNEKLSNCTQEELDFVFQDSYSPWKELEPEDKNSKLRLYVDIDEDLNDRLAEKARELNKSKPELTRELLDRALQN